MPISRIQQARLAAGFSLQQVVDRLPESLRVSRAALHKYETGASMPSARMLMSLGRLYGVRPQSFLSPQDFSVEWIAYRSHRALGRKATETLQARATLLAESRFRVERMFPRSGGARFPKRVHASSLSDAESAAAALRRHWKLGDAPIEALTETIEAHGCVVVEINDPPSGFHGASGWIEAGEALIVISADAAPDRRRFTLAHELGHLALDVSKGKDEEAMAHRFAAAFLLPEDVVKRELGERRSRLALQELLALKQRYGVSVQAWIRRAFDLGVIGRGAYSSTFRELTARGWRTAEPMVYDAERPSSRMRQLLHRAIAEGLVTLNEAEELLPGVTGEPGTREPRPNSARELLKLPMAERDRILALAAERAAPEYASGAIEQFDAFGEADLFDDDPQE